MREYYKKILKELKEVGKEELKTKKIKVVKEQAIFKDLMDREGKCSKCMRVENLTLDHIIPKDILKSFGIDPQKEIIEDNYQLLCDVCNMFKSNKLDFSTPKTKEILLRLLKKV